MASSPSSLRLEGEDRALLAWPLVEEMLLVFLTAEVQRFMADGVIFRQMQIAVGAAHHVLGLALDRLAVIVVVLAQLPLAIHAIEAQACPEQDDEYQQTDDQQAHSYMTPR